jgi:pimeloyl-ACP methyl ester carboxylesterase
MTTRTLKVTIGSDAVTPRTGPARAAGDRVLLASDGTPIMAWHEAGPATVDQGGDRALALVVAHGFTLHARRPGVRAVVSALRRHGGVVSFDFRGHGLSGGASTVGDREVEDVAAAMAWARALGYRHVVTVGWSMGAAVVVRHAALHRGAVDAVVAVSGPSRWHFRGTVPMRLVHRGIETRSGRAVLARAFGTRVAPSGWEPAPEPPDAVAGRIAPVPLLIVHGDADPYFPMDHARWLAAAAGPTAHLWEVPGFGHAEASVGPALVGRIGRWARGTVVGAAAAGGPGDDGDGHPCVSARMPA